MTCCGSTHRGDAPSSPIEWQDHWQPLVLLSQLSSKKSNKQRPLTSLIDSHWAWRAYPVSLLCFVLLIRMARRRNEVILRWSAVAGSMSGRGGSTPPHRLVLSIFGSWSSSQHSGVSLSREYVVKYDPVLIESMLGLIVKKRCVLITNRSNRCCSPQCFNLWQRVAIHRRVGIVLYDSWWRDGIVIVRPSLIHSVS